MLAEFLFDLSFVAQAQKSNCGAQVTNEITDSYFSGNTVKASFVYHTHRAGVLVSIDVAWAERAC
jgi:hypothetical protein